MDVLRHTGRAELASFLGGANAGADASQWQFAPYTEADLRKAAGAGAAASTGRRGSRRSKTSAPTSTGSTPTSPPPTLDPKLKPAEYTLLGQADGTWKPTDVIAIASLVGGIFGRAAATS